jgi:acyl carrier protein
MDVYEFIRKIEEEYEDVPVGLLKPSSNFKEIINWSSINVVVFSTLIEYEYHVMLNPDDFKTINTVSELFELIRSKQG